ncbi:MAG: (2Fe-2S)-binding protein [Bacillota bacterium]|jgi:carbon-monoxide dehydrogenase small subunit
MMEMLGQGMLELQVNGQKRAVLARPADTLLQVLRDQLGLTAAKPACETGDCGACTVLIDGKPVKSCMVLAPEAVGHEITTAEGLKDSPVFQLFVDTFAIQCGFCTPGFIVNAHALVNTCPDAGDDVIDDWMDSNLCRCTGYEEIRAAVKQALAAKKGQG